MTQPHGAEQGPATIELTTPLELGNYRLLLSGALYTHEL